MKTMLTLKTSFISFCLSLIMTTHSAHADDIEIYGIADSGKPPVNVLFIFDVSGSMRDGKNGNDNPPAGESRYELLLEALTNVLIKKKDQSNLRVGVSWFSSNSSGIRWPISSISADAHDIDSDIPAGVYQTYDVIPDLLEADGQPGGATGIVQSLLEATYYFRGEDVWAGQVAPGKWDITQNKYIGGKSGNSWAAIKESYTAIDTSYPPYNGSHAYTDQLSLRTKYNKKCKKSKSWCKNGGSDASHLNVRNCYSHNWQNNKCTYDVPQGGWIGATYNTPITNNCTPNFIVLLSDGQPTSNNQDTRNRVEQLSGKQCADISGLSSGKCGPELAEFLANNDQINGLPSTKVKTYTIGFNVTGSGRTYLELLAEKGDGFYYSASSTTELENTFDLIIESVSGDNESFTGLSTSIRASTLSSDNRVFMNMFKPGIARSWVGNTKGYFIDTAGLLDTNENEIISAADGTILDTARSFWSSADDGNKVELGGAAGKINANSRTIYTYTDTEAPSDSSLVQVTASENTITPELLGLSTNTEKNDLVNWLKASKMADPLHTSPLLISYENQDVLYSMTNQGMIHAIDTTNPTGFNDYSGGNELFAFIPQALLPKLKEHEAGLTTGGHLYGLDGPISYWHNDTDGNKIVNNNEEIFLYFGMRRGGNHYYALDVSNPSAPKLAWRIDGGIGNYAELGQTWSRMVPTTVKWTGGTQKKVLIFGGGYDEDQDDHSMRTTDDIGNAIFIVDAQSSNETGEERFLWKATQSPSMVDMRYSIPSDITVIDTDSDQLADRLYVGDMGGQVWSFNINSGSPSGYVLADLAQDNSELQNRRFYSPPSVAKINGGSSFYYAVAIGSGFRAHPLQMGVQDNFYMIKDTNTEDSATAVTSTFSDSDLYDITDNLIGEAPTAQEKADAQSDLADANGWKLTLQDTGEKSLSPSLIFDKQLSFTTFNPANEGNDVCGGGGGAGSFYLINLEDATPMKNLTDDSTNSLTASHRSKSVPGMGIPSQPIPYFPEGKGEVNLYVGKEKVTSIDNPLHRINWKAVE